MHSTNLLFHEYVSELFIYSESKLDYVTSRHIFVGENIQSSFLKNIFQKGSQIVQQ